MTSWNLANTGSCNGLSVVWWQILTWTSVNSLSIGNWETKFIEMQINIHWLKMHLKMLSVIWPFCLNSNVNFIDCLWCHIPVRDSLIWYLYHHVSPCMTYMEKHNDTNINEITWPVSSLRKPHSIVILGGSWETLLRDAACLWSQEANFIATGAQQQIRWDCDLGIGKLQRSGIKVIGWMVLVAFVWLPYWPL